ncbi:MAG TPA: carboxypeptidase regulatory-like domain-containing protein [Candidatus Limnocylindria bacterium]|nr:carboxypeptidase regulatory-like domain-containing protein [Candidatus Limnocylindria bacterium]
MHLRLVVVPLVMAGVSYGQDTGPSNRQAVGQTRDAGTVSAPQTSGIAASGAVRTSEGTTVPGATVRITNVQTNKSWVSWTDETGKFAISALPPGRYRMEASQLGFVTAAQELVIAGPPAPVVAISLRVATLVELNPPVEAPTSEKTAATNPDDAAASGPRTRNRPGHPATSEGAGTPGAPGGAPERGGRQGQAPAGVTNAIRQGMGGFQQTDLTGESSGQGEETVAPQNGAGAGPQPTIALSSGGGASSDAFLLQGTVGQALSPNGPGGSGFGGPGGGAGPGGFVPGDPGGPGGPGGGPGGPAGRGGGFGGGGGGFGGVQGFGAGPGGGRDGGGGGGRLARQTVNRIRFSFFDRYENSDFDAKPYSITGAERPKVSHYDERVGGSLGGPFRIPRLYDGKDRTLFFVNYQHEIAQTGVNTFSTVPTKDERSGNFCNDFPGLQIFNPFSNLSGPRTLLNPANPCQIPQFLPSPPSAPNTPSLNSAALGLLNFYPLPNLPGTVQNFLLQATTPLNSDTVNLHLLHTINSKFSVSGTYNLNSVRQDLLGNFPGISGNQSTLNQSADLGLTQTWSPKLVQDTHINWSRSRLQVLSSNSFTNNVAGNLGINGVSTSPMDFGIPALSLSSISGPNDPIPSLVRNQTFRFTDSITSIRGKHTLKFGGEVRRIQLNTESSPVPRGNFTFTGLMTSQLDANGQPLPGNTTANDLADFLLGLPYSTRAQFGPNLYFRSWDFIAYAQDDWRVNKRFTFAYGLRYEAVTPPIELNNQIANLDMNAVITAVNVVTPQTNANLFNGPYPRALVHGDYRNWAPRIGFAWQPFDIKPKTVVRGGYSIFYNVSAYNTLAQTYLGYEAPFATSQKVITSAAQVLTVENGFPVAAQSPTQVSCTTVTPCSNTGAINPFYKDGYAQIWTLGTETSFTQNWILDLTYTGTKGTNLDLLRAPNRAPLGTPPTETQQLLQIPGATSFYFDQSGANSIYNALQVRLVHRFTKGFMMQAIYTFGKSLDNASSIGGGMPVVVQQDGNFAAERGLSSFDIRHQLRIFSMYELPFGEHHRYGTHGWAMHAFGNWRLLNIVTWHTGTPFTALLGGTASDNGTGASFSLRPNRIGDPNLGICGGSPLGYFDTRAFVQPPTTQYGDEQRGSIEGPCAFNWNVSLAKGFRFGPQERHRIDIRWEVQNLTNTPSFNGLGTTLGSTLFGRVTSAASMRTMDGQIRFNF